MSARVEPGANFFAASCRETRFTAELPANWGLCGRIARRAQKIQDGPCEGVGLFLVEFRLPVCYTQSRGNCADEIGGRPRIGGRSDGAAREPALAKFYQKLTAAD